MAEMNRLRSMVVAVAIAMTLPIAAAQGIAPQATPAVSSAAATASAATDVAGKLPEFDAATIKPASPKDNAIGLFTYPGGSIVCSLCTLQYLVTEAFNLQDWQVSGGPSWLKSTQYDIEAKPPESSEAIHLNNAVMKTPPTAEQRQMLQSLLMDRFQLKFHRVQKEGDIYILSRGNKPLKLQPPKAPDEFHWAGIVDGGLTGNNISMPELATRLSGLLSRPVVDQTGLMGSYDFEYRTGDNEPDSSPMVVITTSMREIGLKLTSAKGLVETIVIDQAEPPSPN